MKKYIKISHIEEIELEDLSYRMLEELEVDEEDDYSYYNDLRYENYKISIDDLKDVIKVLEFNGAKYCQIVHHEDHRGYIFEGIKVEICDEYNSKELERNKLENIIKMKESDKDKHLKITNDLDRQIESFKKELEKL